MKQALLLFSLLLTTTSLPAQNTDFAPVGAKWYYAELDFALNVRPHIIESVGKETFEGKWCSKLVLNQPSDDLKIQVSPNPFQERIQITVQSLPSAHRFLLFNQMGVLILRKDFEESFDIETSALSSGIYHWTVEQEGRMLGRGSCMKLE